MLFYIAGPMSGMIERNRPAFFAAEALLRSMGHTCLNPAVNEDNMGWDKTWAQYMMADALCVRKAQAVALLPGWHRSKGATIEVVKARRMHKPIFELIDGALVRLPITRTYPGIPT